MLTAAPRSLNKLGHPDGSNVWVAMWTFREGPSTTAQRGIEVDRCVSPFEGFERVGLCGGAGNLGGACVCGARGCGGASDLGVEEGGASDLGTEEGGASMRGGLGAPSPRGARAPKGRGGMAGLTGVHNPAGYCPACWVR